MHLQVQAAQEASTADKARAEELTLKLATAEAAMQASAEKAGAPELTKQLESLEQSIRVSTLRFGLQTPLRKLGSYHCEQGMQAYRAHDVCAASSAMTAAEQSGNCQCHAHPGSYALEPAMKK